ncbi:MAG: glycosyltransferase family 4 protein [Bacteroidia bacterium]|nr:glycosyltransferase family 4 protein [Bacteroidia bacterium]
MKIFFVIRGLHDPGGIERVTSVLADGLVERGYEIGIVCLQQGEPFFPLSKSVKRFYLPSNVLLRVRNLKKLYARENPDIIVFVGSHRLLMNIPAAKGIPNITWEHFNAKVNWHPLHKLSRRWAVKYSNKIVTLTQQDVENYVQIFDAKNVICIPNSITIPNIETTPLTEKRVLAVGRLASQKGFDLLLDAWEKTKNRKNGWNLRIVGSGSHLNRLQKQILENGISDSVEIISTTKNIVEQYKQASVMVMSSRYEGLPLVLIETMASGLPIVSFDCQTGPAEIVEHNKTGILVPALNVEKLAEALDEVMEDGQKRKTFSENALLRAKLFDLHRIVDLWENLFREILVN